LKRSIKRILVLGILFSSFVWAQESNFTQNLPQENAMQSEGIITSDKPKVLLQTNLGDIELELYPDKAPISVENFLKYVNDGFYDGLIFHRVVYNFVIQGGGFDANLVQKTPIYLPIKSESDNGLNNDKGTLAMARTNDPNSATSQFYINLRDNKDLNHDSNPPNAVSPFGIKSVQPKVGYTVFGKVTKGMDVVNKIAKSDIVARGGMKDVPKNPITISKASVLVGNED